MLSFNIDILTLPQVKELITSTDDTQHSQIRVSKDGEVFVSRTIGSKDIENLQFRYETFDAGNGYIGEKAASDDRYVEQIFNFLKSDWEHGRVGYLDNH
ncbi:hypothetical protein [Candidatus Enterococcus ikei]|uniref:Uncharacterized protein n=1 Tax=Candidatus Enterococcus ikei TaxID=2815326 RepID=A0ABS3GUR5_9ENTE|nr:hypothetical protein [Enterococcus sp. DIV0869a]MBO0439005.1 hypothetical protein [Enterococcus sp. DIV0869a]